MIRDHCGQRLKYMGRWENVVTKKVHHWWRCEVCGRDFKDTYHGENERGEAF